jgi:hypothetical protein
MKAPAMGALLGNSLAKFMATEEKRISVSHRTYEIELRGAHGLLFHLSPLGARVETALRRQLAEPPSSPLSTSPQCDFSPNWGPTPNRHLNS